MLSDPSAPRFRGFRSPNYTQVPDELFDELLSVLSGAELKVLLYIIRRTFGFKRDADAISLSQMMHGITTREGNRLDRGVGLSKPTLLQALRSLEINNIIETTRQRSTERGDEPTIYQLKFTSDDAHASSADPVVKKLDQGVVKKPNPPVVKKSTPQETVLQETDNKLSNIRKRSHADFSVDNSATHLVTPHRNGSAGEGNAAPKTSDTISVGEDDTGSVPVKQWGMEAIGEILKKKGRGRPSKQESEERAMIMAFISDFAREFQDQAQLKSSVSRAFNIYRESGLSPVIFQDRMYQSRIRTKERRAAIKGSRMAYFFACLEQEAGLREAPEHSSRGAAHMPNR